MDSAEFIKILEYFRMTSAGLSLPAIIALVYFLWRNGIISFKGTDNSSQNVNYQDQIDILRTDVKEVKTDVREARQELSDVAEDVSFIRGRMSR